MNYKYTLIVFFLLFFIFGYFFHTNQGYNANSHLGLILAIVQEGRLTIDSFHHRPDTFTNDTSFFNGHYYSNKAPGTALLGAMVYLPMYWLSELINSELSINYIRYLIILFVIGLPSALAGSLVYVLSEHISKNRLHAYMVTLAITLGTMYLPFSTQLFSHQLAASLLFIAFFMIFKINHSARKLQGAEEGKVFSFLNSSSLQYHLLIGLLLGFALITEYTVTVIVFALMIYYLSSLCKARRRGNLGLIISATLIGILIPVALCLGYNTLCFGGPFSIGYMNLTVDEWGKGMGQGLMGISWPKGIVLYYITFHPFRGLFVQSPVLIAALIGFCPLFIDPRWRKEAVLSTFVFITFLLINAGYFYWSGGWSFGPRFLIPMLPFLSLPIIFFPKRFFKIFMMLTLLSMFQMFIVTASHPQTSDKIIFMMERGETPFKVLPFFGFSPIYGDCLKKLSEGHYALNIGNIFHLYGFKSLLPLIIALVAVSAFFFINSERPKSDVVISGQ